MRHLTPSYVAFIIAILFLVCPCYVEPACCNFESRSFFEICSFSEDAKVQLRKLFSECHSCKVCLSMNFRDNYVWYFVNCSSLYTDALWSDWSYYIDIWTNGTVRFRQIHPSCWSFMSDKFMFLSAAVNTLSDLSR